MQQRSILITGAASGIGRSTAILFASKGWYVGGFDLDQAGLDSLRAEIDPNLCFCRFMDVADPGSVKGSLAALSSRTGGRLDVLFNNAGIIRMGPFQDINLDDQLDIVDVNLKGVITVTHAALPLLEKTPGAHIISMASTSAVYGIPELAVYSATKHAICGLTEALDLELEKYGISVSDIVAPYVRTPLVTEARRRAYSVEKTGIKLRPEQVAAVVWKAAHRHKLHWKMQASTYLFLLVFRLFPAIRRPVVRYLALTPQQHEAHSGREEAK